MRGQGEGAKRPGAQAGDHPGERAKRAMGRSLDRPSKLCSQVVQCCFGLVDGVALRSKPMVYRKDNTVTAGTQRRWVVTVLTLVGAGFVFLETAISNPPGMLQAFGAFGLVPVTVSGHKPHPRKTLPFTYC